MCTDANPYIVLITKRTIFLAPEKNHVMAGGNYKKKIMPKMPKMTKFPKTILY